MRRTLLALTALLVGACSDPDRAPIFPTDYAATYQEVRNCRFSLEHDLINIRVLASPDAIDPYQGRALPFPTGAILVKEQYGEDDAACAGPIVDYTVMKKLEDGSAPDDLDWEWQKVDADFHNIDKPVATCVNCHTDCGKSPEGYAGTCTVP